MLVLLLCLSTSLFGDPTPEEAKENTKIVNNWIKENQKLTDFTKKYNELGEKLSAFNVQRVSPVDVNPSAIKKCEELQKIAKAGKIEVEAIDFNGNVLLLVQKDYKLVNLFLGSSNGYKKVFDEAVCGYSIYSLGKDTPEFLDLTDCGGSGFRVNLYTIEQGAVLKKVLEIGGWQPNETYVDIDNDGVSEIINSHRVSKVDQLEEKLTHFNPPLVMVQEDFYKYKNGLFENAGRTYRVNNSDLIDETEKKPESKCVRTEEADMLVYRYYYSNGVLKEIERVKKYPDGGGWLREGLQETYYINGKTKLKRWCKKQAPHGAWEEFYENGKYICKKEYDNGNAKGMWKFFKEDGTLTAEENYSDSEKKVIKTKYYDNGKVKYKSSYQANSDTWEIIDYEIDGRVKKNTIIESGNIK